MATSRKPFIRIGTSLIREPWTRDEKLTLVLLSCFLGDRWARDRLTADEACTAVLTRDQLHAITGRGQLVHARRALSALGARVSLAIRIENEFTEIHWPKFADFQELPSRGRESKARRKPKSAPAPAPAQSHRSEGTNAVARNPASAKPRQKTIPKGNVPDWALANADVMIELLRTIEGARIPRGARKSWGQHIARMPDEIEFNGRDPAGFIEAGIRWVLGPENSGEYALVVRSGKALREKWPRIVTAAKRRLEHSPEGKQAKRKAQVEKIKEDLKRGRASK